MSHLSKIRTQIIDTETLIETLNDLEIEFQLYKEDNTNKLSIIVEKNLLTSDKSTVKFIWVDNNYELLADSSTWQEKRFLEHWHQTVYQKYAYNIIIKEALKQGFESVETKSYQNNNGSIKLVLEKWS
uniref:Uncharacterized protein ycf35 n=1 Tax=Hommersandiophycus borowitzkae TaxID=268573 RepID=A0A1G4NTR5_9FLOR|nr:Hypothetical protein ycf35 [Hommersandiophycus borowitzkae]SCW22072.1 Hypothetical protein ycf35 [Hommersandiophycus borowitzkae]